MMKSMMRSSKLQAGTSVVRPARASRATTVKPVAAFTEFSSTQAYLKTLPGITAPFTDVFDPAGLSEKASIKEVRRWRESEVTHGRVAMLAALGFIVGEQLSDFPLFFNFDGRVSGPAINHFQQIGQGFWEPLLIAIGVAESYRVAVGWATPVGTGFNTLKDEYNMGDLGFDPLGIKPTDPAELKEMQTKELNNGRLAMIAIAAFVAQELDPNIEIFEHLVLRFEREAILELDDIERDVGLPVTPLPEGFPQFNGKTPVISNEESKNYKAVAITLANLKDSQNGTATRNVDGVIYHISYVNEEIVVEDRRLGVRYPATVGEDLRIKINTAKPLTVGRMGATAVTVESLVPILKGDSDGAEVLNGRTAMVGFLITAVVEVTTGQSALQQLTSPVGGACALGLGVAVLVASLAPAFLGGVMVQNVIANEKQSYADSQLPAVWSPAAEKVNSRVAMLGFLGLIATELIKGSNVFSF
ncbi:MAG: hypothetical protein WDW38_004739 [Sanguina aurantia]